MPEIKDGGPAFPGEVPNGAVYLDPVRGMNRAATEPTPGMTLRAYFAAKALQGFCANPAVFAANDRNGWALVNCTERQLTDLCARLADEAIASLEAEP